MGIALFAMFLVTPPLHAQAKGNCNVVISAPVVGVNRIDLKCSDVDPQVRNGLADLLDKTQRAIRDLDDIKRKFPATGLPAAEVERLFGVVYQAEYEAFRGHYRLSLPKVELVLGFPGDEPATTSYVGRVADHYRENRTDPRVARCAVEERATALCYVEPQDKLFPRSVDLNVAGTEGQLLAILDRIRVSVSCYTADQVRALLNGPRPKTADFAFDLTLPPTSGRGGLGIVVASPWSARPHLVVRAVALQPGLNDVTKRGDIVSAVDLFGGLCLVTLHPVSVGDTHPNYAAARQLLDKTTVAQLLWELNDVQRLFLRASTWVSVKNARGEPELVRAFKLPATVRDLDQFQVNR